jgi:8-oxo-dGTP diphosphatase
MWGHRTGTLEGQMTVSGDGFVTLGDGSQRWGRFGAAGVLVRHLDDAGEPHFFLALRSSWTHKGGTWAVPGGALNHGEAALEGALREFAEEIGHQLDGFEVAHTYEDDHGGWTYTTVVVDVPERFEPPAVLQWETAECRWVHASELAELELFDAFRSTLVELGLLGGEGLVDGPLGLPEE